VLAFDAQRNDKNEGRKNAMPEDVTMKRMFSLIVVAAALLLTLPLPGTANSTSNRPLAAPYVGEWSNGRGDTLTITGSTIKFGNDKAVNYRDITRVTNGREFDLQITTEGNLNYLTKYLHVSFGDGDKTDEMKMTLYDSLKDLQDGANSQGEATWDRDK
jgi:hypothetical protein